MVFCVWDKGFNGYEYVNNIKSQRKHIKDYRRRRRVLFLVFQQCLFKELQADLLLSLLTIFLM